MKTSTAIQEIERITKSKFWEYRGNPQYAMASYLKSKVSEHHLKNLGLGYIFKEGLNEILWWKKSFRQKKAEDVIGGFLKKIVDQGYFSVIPEVKFKSIRNKLGFRRLPGLYLKDLIGGQHDGLISLSTEKNSEFVLSSQLTRGKDLSSVGEEATNVHALILVILHELTHAQIHKNGLSFNSPRLTTENQNILNSWVAPKHSPLTTLYEEMASDAYSMMILMKESGFSPEARTTCEKMLELRKNPPSGVSAKFLIKRNQWFNDHDTKDVVQRVLDEQHLWENAPKEDLFNKACQYATEGVLDYFQSLEKTNNALFMSKVFKAILDENDIVFRLVLNDLRVQKSNKSNVVFEKEDQNKSEAFSIVSEGYQAIKNDILPTIDDDQISLLSKKDFLKLLLGAMKLSLKIKKILNDEVSGKVFKEKTKDFQSHQDLAYLDIYGILTNDKKLKFTNLNKFKGSVSSEINDEGEVIKPFPPNPKKI